MLDRIVQQVATTNEPLEDFQRSPYNASFVLGMCLKSFSGQAKSSKSGSSSFDLAEICQRWGWSESVVDALAYLAMSRYVTSVLLISWLTSFEFWAPRPITAGDHLRKSERIIAVTLTVITVKRFAYPFFPPGHEIPRREGGHQEVLAMREYLD